MKKGLSAAAKQLLAGKVGVLPTDTLYGLVCQAGDRIAVRRLYDLKNREQKPGTIIVANIGQLTTLGIKARYLKAVEHFWPNPLSIVIPCHNLEYIHQGKGTVAVRIPDDGALQKLLTQTGPLVTTSANQPGEPPANTIDEAKDYFGEAVDFYIDGGDLSGRQPSTVIRIVDDVVEVLRAGATKIDKHGTINSKEVRGDI